MSVADVYIEDSPERQQIERWRAEELERAGYAPAVAAELAASVHVDLHEAVDLVRRGCAPDLAAKILL